LPSLLKRENKDAYSTDGDQLGRLLCGMIAANGSVRQLIIPETVPKIMLNVSFQMRALLLSSQSNILGGTAGANISNSKLFGLIRLLEYEYTYSSLVGGVVYIYSCCEHPNEFESLHTKPLSELGTVFLLTTYVTDTHDFSPQL
jgi:hypothetical protein